jgi:hypothetical protein
MALSNGAPGVIAVSGSAVFPATTILPWVSMVETILIHAGSGEYPGRQNSAVFAARPHHKSAARAAGSAQVNTPVGSNRIDGAVRFQERGEGRRRAIHLPPSSDWKKAAAKNANRCAYVHATLKGTADEMGHMICITVSSRVSRLPVASVRLRNYDLP